MTEINLKYHSRSPEAAATEKWSPCLEHRKRHVNSEWEFEIIYGDAKENNVTQHEPQFLVFLACFRLTRF